MARMTSEPTIVFEASEFFGLYDENVDSDYVFRVMSYLLKKTHRFGLDQMTYRDPASPSYVQHFMESLKHTDIDGLKTYMLGMRGQDLQGSVEAGLARALDVFREGKFTPPTVFITAGFLGTDACVVPGGFGINLVNLFHETRGDMALSMKHLESKSAHESIHTFLAQHIVPKEVNQLHPLRDARGCIYGEGLATFVERPDCLNYGTFMPHADEWEEVAWKVVSSKKSAKGPGMEYLRILQDLYAQPVLKGYDRGERILGASINRFAVGEGASEGEFQSAVNSVFVEANGPAYYVGCNKWETIAEEFGIEGVRDVVATRDMQTLFDKYAEIKAMRGELQPYHIW